MKPEKPVILKSVCGIDISKDHFNAGLVSLTDDNKRLELSSNERYANSQSGFKKLLHWVQAKTKDNPDKVLFVLEATGVYFESLAHFLSDNSQQIAVVLPRRSNAFRASLAEKSKTDKTDAIMLGHFGLDRQPELFQPADPTMQKLRALSRELQQLKHQRTVHQNQLHAVEHSYQPIEASIERHRKSIEHYDAQIRAIESDIKKVTNNDPDLKERIDQVATIKGVGVHTVISVLAETNGFLLFENARQLTSYSGLDVRHNQSGKKTGKSKISKAGNVHIRAALYMPTLSAIKYNRQFRELYNRLLQRTKIKMVAITAVMRKMLLLIYTLWKKRTIYDPNYLSQTT